MTTATSGPERELGGGSGGGPGDGVREETTDKTHVISANQISLLAQFPLPPAIPDRSLITILAAGTDLDGVVNVRGSLGVRVTAGPPPGLPVDKLTTNGVDIAVGQLGSVTLTRGLLPTDQKVELTPMGITINAGTMPVTIESLTEITLKVAGGVSKLTITPDGVKIEAPTVKITALAEAEITGVMNKVTALGMNKITGPLTMIG